MTIFGREPAAWIGLALTLILGVLATLAGEGFISEALAGQLTDMFSASAELLLQLSPFIAGLVIRFGVFSPSTTQRLVNRAAATGNTDIGDPPAGT